MIENLKSVSRSVRQYLTRSYYTPHSMTFLISLVYSTNRGIKNKSIHLFLLKVYLNNMMLPPFTHCGALFASLKDKVLPKGDNSNRKKYP